MAMPGTDLSSSAWRHSEENRVLMAISRSKKSLTKEERQIQRAVEETRRDAEVEQHRTSYEPCILCQLCGEEEADGVALPCTGRFTFNFEKACSHALCREHARNSLHAQLKAQEEQTSVGAGHCFVCKARVTFYLDMEQLKPIKAKKQVMGRAERAQFNKEKQQQRRDEAAVARAVRAIPDVGVPHDPPEALDFDLVAHEALDSPSHPEDVPLDSPSQAEAPDSDPTHFYLGSGRDAPGSSSQAPEADSEAEIEVVSEGSECSECEPYDEQDTPAFRRQLALCAALRP